MNRTKTIPSNKYIQIVNRKIADILSYHEYITKIIWTKGQ